MAFLYHFIASLILPWSTIWYPNSVAKSESPDATEKPLSTILNVCSINFSFRPHYDKTKTKTCCEGWNSMQGKQLFRSKEDQNCSIKNLKRIQKIVLQHVWRAETSCRKALGCVVPESPSCWSGLKAASLTANGGIKNSKLISTLPQLYHKCQYLQFYFDSFWFASLRVQVWTCENFTSVISPSLHKECRASIRSASRLFLSFCKSLKYDTRCCKWSPSPTLNNFGFLWLIAIEYLVLLQ